ncbi:MAG: hypothetical protein ACLQG5_09275 [Methanobacterium sp.]|jgi:hypothetical protein
MLQITDGKTNLTESGYIKIIYVTDNGINKKEYEFFKNKIKEYLTNNFKSKYDMDFKIEEFDANQGSLLVTLYVNTNNTDVFSFQESLEVFKVYYNGFKQKYENL